MEKYEQGEMGKKLITIKDYMAISPSEQAKNKLLTLITNIRPPSSLLVETITQREIIDQDLFRDSLTAIQDYIRREPKELELALKALREIRADLFQALGATDVPKEQVRYQRLYGMVDSCLQWCEIGKATQSNRNRN